jgi:small subunit ribosomal protein S6
LESTSVTKLNRACQLNDSILRQLVIKIDPRLVDTMVAVAKGEAVPGTEEDGEAGETPAVESAEAAPAT